MPDKASLYMFAIEDRQYKEDRIDCKCFVFFLMKLNVYLRFIYTVVFIT